MIFYFSGTGNSEYIAKLLGERTGEEIYNIAECVGKSKEYFKLKKGERLGFVYPIYCWGLPDIVEKFVKNTSFDFYGKHYTYSVATCGASTGRADEDLAILLKAKNIPMHASFAIKMVDNYTVLFSVKNKEKNEKVNNDAKETITDMLFMVNARVGGYYNKKRGIWPVSHVVHKSYKLCRITKPFAVSDECIGCGACAKNCPSKAIVMKEGKPVWVKKNCTMCLSCLHKCPKNAINYGPSTKKNGQYVFEENENKEE